MRRHLTSLVVFAAAACGAPTPPDPPAEDVRRLAAALDILATDYERIARDGTGVTRLRKMIHDAKGYARRVSGSDGVDEVASLVYEGAAPDRVVSAARELRRRILALHGPVAAPLGPPSRERGAKLWRMLCAACHGAGGLGDGPQGLFLDPEPRSFRDPQIMHDLSPLRAYSAITDGIPGTDMPAWGTFTSDDRWALAFHVFGLRHSPAAVTRGAVAIARTDGSPAVSPTRLAGLTDGDLLDRLADRGLQPDTAADALAWLRVEGAYHLPPTRLGEARAELLAALAANRRGDDAAATDAVDRAYDLTLGAVAPLRWRARPLAGRLDRIFAAARRLAARGVVDEVLERALRKVGALLDEAEELLAP